MSKILVVDDEVEIVNLVDLYLRENHEILKANDGREALKIISMKDVDIAIVDIMMPKLNGYDLVREIRRNKNIPIIILSAKSEGYDKVIGLNIGADDYVTKPFDPLELVARVNAQLRRVNKLSYKPEQVSTDIIEIGDISLDKDKMIVKKKGKEIQLTSTEYRILQLLISNPNKVFTKKHIFELIWDEPYFQEDNAIMVHISNLRDKIEDNPREPVYIKTIRRLGYRLEAKND